MGRRRNTLERNKGSCSEFFVLMNMRAKALTAAAVVIWSGKCSPATVSTHLCQHWCGLLPPRAQTSAVDLTSGSQASCIQQPGEPLLSDHSSAQLHLESTVEAEEIFQLQLFCFFFPNFLPVCGSTWKGGGYMLLQSETQSRAVLFLLLCLGRWHMLLLVM